MSGAASITGGLAPGIAVGIAAGLGAGAFWGTAFVAPLAAPAFSSVDHTAGRFVACGLFSLVWMVWQTLMAPRAQRRLLWPDANQALSAGGMSVLGYTGYYLLLVYGIADAGAALCALVIGTMPLWMMLAGKPQGLLWRAMVPGLVLTLGGMLLLMRVTAAEVDADSMVHFWRGLLLATGAMLSWLAFGLLNVRWLRQHPAVNSTAWANWLGLASGLGGVLLWWGWGTPWQTLLVTPGLGRFVVACAVTGIGSAWMASVLWNVASRRLSTSLAGQLVVSETVFALIYAFAWNGQWPAPLQFAACLLFVMGILASVRAHR